MSVLIKNMEMPKGCIYANDNDQTEYCPLLNHDDVPFCQYIESEPEIAIGIGERPVYCPLSDVPEPCENTVSRQAAIDVLSLGKEILSRVLDDMDVVGTDREKYSWGLGLIESNIKDIEELPSAQPQPRTGKWIVHLYKLGEGRYECDNCHGRCDREYKFCPNCGAKMKGEGDE